MNIGIKWSKQFIWYYGWLVTEGPFHGSDIYHGKIFRDLGGIAHIWNWNWNLEYIYIYIIEPYEEFMWKQIEHGSL